MIQLIDGQTVTGQTSLPSNKSYSKTDQTFPTIQLKIFQN